MRFYQFTCIFGLFPRNALAVETVREVEASLLSFGCSSPSLSAACFFGCLHRYKGLLNPCSFGSVQLVNAIFHVKMINMKLLL